jgi:hypothetical protein
LAQAIFKHWHTEDEAAKLINKLRLRERKMRQAAAQADMGHADEWEEGAEESWIDGSTHAQNIHCTTVGAVLVLASLR